MNYPLAPSGIFTTIQGEGHLLGLPMVFIRLAGCNVNCPECDTDYSVSERLSPEDIARRVCDLVGTNGVVQYVWITGGEPTIHDLSPLRKELRKIAGLKLALATAGHQPVSRFDWDWVSVSPHSPTDWVENCCDEIKFVPGLNGSHLRDFPMECLADRGCLRFVQPLEGSESSLHECLEWVMSHPGWRITLQAHKEWRIP